MKKKFLVKNLNIILSVIMILVCLAFLFIIDVNKKSNIYLITIIEKSLVYAVVALSMNLVIGFTGLFSLGQAGFMAIGAYITAMFTIPIEFRESIYYVKGINADLANMILPIPIAIILGGLVAAIIAAIIGIPILKLKSDYLAIATLGLSEIIRAIIASPMMDTITNGSYGLKRIPSFSSVLECFIYCGICILLMALVINSSYGRDFKAIREDEVAARAVGIDIFKAKEISFVISSFFAGVAGGLLAMFMRSIDSRTFSVNLTYEILLIVVLGGIGSITGSIIGSFVVNIGKEVLRVFDKPFIIFNFNVDWPIFREGFRMVIFSILLMVVVLFFKKGIMGGKEFTFDNIIKFFKKKGEKHE